MSAKAKALNRKISTLFVLSLPNTNMERVFPVNPKIHRTPTITVYIAKLKSITFGITVGNVLQLEYGSMVVTVTVVLFPDSIVL